MMFDQKLIFTGEKFSIKDEVIQYLANKAQEVGKLDSCESYIAAVKKREQEFSTAIGYNIAFTSCTKPYNEIGLYESECSGSV